MTQIAINQKKKDTQPKPNTKQSTWRYQNFWLRIKCSKELILIDSKSK